MANIKIKIQDKKANVVMNYVEPVDASTTLADFKKKLCQESEYLSKFRSLLSECLHREKKVGSNPYHVVFCP